MNSRRPYKLLFLFLGLLIGLIFAIFDRWVDVQHKLFLISWSAILIVFVTTGGIFGALLGELVNALIKKDELLVKQKMAVLEFSKLQGEIARLERLNLVGQLAAGLAHEIRNPLTTVRGYLQLLASKGNFEQYQPKFDLMIDEIDRSNVIITEFLSFVKDPNDKMKSQNINDTLHHLYPLLEADAFSQNKQILLKTSKTPEIVINAQEIAQLVLNLCRNGFEAMQERGMLTILTYLENDNVVLSIQDEGCGIPSEHLDKLGTPFFTTKENGTGLGIANCYRIAERHKAKVKLESDSTGTKFFVYFPLSGAL